MLTRKRNILIVLILGFVLLTGCNRTSAKSPEPKKTPAATASPSPDTMAEPSRKRELLPAEDIDMACKIAGSRGVLVTVTNNGDSACTLGDDYYLDIYFGESWQRLDFRPGRVYSDLDTEYILEPGEALDLSYGWITAYGQLAPGEFRIVKSVRPAGLDDDDYYIAAEFEVSADEDLS